MTCDLMNFGPDMTLAVDWVLNIIEIVFEFYQQYTFIGVKRTSLLRFKEIIFHKWLKRK